MNKTIEFDSKVTAKELADFKLYHNYHNMSGIFGVIFAIFALGMSIVLNVFYPGKVNLTYTLMMAALGIFFLVYPPLSMISNSKKQVKKNPVFNIPVHYVVNQDKIVLSQGELSEELSWDNIYKIRFTGKNLVLYITAIRADVLPINTMGVAAIEFVEMAKEKLLPFQVRVDEKRLRKVVEKNG